MRRGLLQTRLAVLYSLLLFFALSCSQQSQALKQDDAQQLIAHLQQERPDQQQRRETQAIVDKSQVISLDYEKDIPIKSDSDRKNRRALIRTLREKGAFVTGIDHHSQGKIYPRLSITFSRFHREGDSTPETWLGSMRLPFKAGYELRSAWIAYIPAGDTKKATFQKCGTIAVKIGKELEGLRTRFEQLKDFDGTKLSDREWDGGDWPQYPGIYYRYGFGAEIPNTKGLYKKTTESWCQISFWFAPMKGYPQAHEQPGKEYSRQGMKACWIVKSANDGFNKEVSQIIVSALQPLDEYEKELENKK